MNKKALEFYKKEIMDGLAKLSEDHQVVFKRMYSPHNLDKELKAVVNDMPEDKLDWALTQVANSINKIANQNKAYGND